MEAYRNNFNNLNILKSFTKKLETFLKPKHFQKLRLKCKASILLKLKISEA